MPSFNKVIVMGNLTRDPDVRIVGANAVKVCRFALALNERRRDRSGNMVETPVFVEVDAWERDGVKIQKLKIRATTVKFMPLPAPNQSRLTGEPLMPYGSAPASDMDGYDMD